MTLFDWSVLYLIALAVFFVMDAAWLKFGAYPMFRKDMSHLLAPKMRLWAAGVFYLFYVAGVLYLASGPAIYSGDYGAAFLNGFILGALAYGTYDATNLSTLKGWTLRFAVLDTSWGAFVTGTFAMSAPWIARTLGLM